MIFLRVFLCNFFNQPMDGLIMPLKHTLSILVVLCSSSLLYAAPSSELNSLTNQVLSVSDRPTDSVINWASNKVKVAFSYNWVNYKEVMRDAESYFTKIGYEHYLKSLKDSGNTESVTSKKLILQVKPNGPAKVIKEGMYQNKYAWQIEVPAVFTYYTASSLSTVKADIVVLVSREPLVDFKDGLAISQLLLKPYK